MGMSSANGIFRTYGEITLEIRDKDVTSINIDYDNYGRSFHFEIELPENWAEGSNTLQVICFCLKGQSTICIILKLLPEMKKVKLYGKEDGIRIKAKVLE